MNETELYEKKIDYICVSQFSEHSSRIQVWRMILNIWNKLEII